MALVDIASQEVPTPVSLSAIAQRQELPLPYLEQLFNKMKKAGLVQSCRGSNGGYQLSQLPEAIYVYDIITAVDTPLKATRCNNHPKQGCHSNGSRCLTHDLWAELDTVVENFLKGISLADVCYRRIHPRRANVLEVDSCILSI
jgi:Rrf2 family iron-sulfur cluster assembly transcriptional regulator